MYICTYNKFCVDVAFKVDRKEEEATTSEEDTEDHPLVSSVEVERPRKKVHPFLKLLLAFWPFGEAFQSLRIWGKCYEIVKVCVCVSTCIGVCVCLCCAVYCVPVCVSTCINVYVYVCECVFLSAYCVYVSVYLCYVCFSICLCMCMYICVYCHYCVYITELINNETLFY